MASSLKKYLLSQPTYRLLEIQQDGGLKLPAYGVERAVKLFWIGPVMFWERVTEASKKAGSWDDRPRVWASEGEAMHWIRIQNRRIRLSVNEKFLVAEPDLKRERVKQTFDANDNYV
jgi:hypothetical protein